MRLSSSNYSSGCAVTYHCAFTLQLSDAPVLRICPLSQWSCSFSKFANSFHDEWMLDFILCKLCLWASLVDQLIKNLPARQEIRVQSLGWEDPLEKEMATHSSVFAWRIPWTEEPGRLHSPWSCNSRTQLSN